MNKTVKLPRPIRVLQFGEGNFLRAFADATIDEGNRAGILDCGVAIVKPRNSGNLQVFKNQSCLYTTAIRGLENGRSVETEQIIACIQQAIQPHEEPEAYREIYMGKDLKFVISNTTEAGIIFDPTDTCDGIPKTFPGKLTKILHDRYIGFGGAVDAGLYMIPCELIENNGAVLKQCVESYAKLWAYDDAFLSWVDASCIFAGTLVDRIVSGYPKENAGEFERKLGYSDPLLVVAEPYQLWAIEADERLKEALPLDKVSPNIIFTDDVRPYRQRKVRILNGCHTLLTPTALLWGKEYVRECMDDATLCAFLEKAVSQEIIPAMDCLTQEELFGFYEDVKNRFANPYLNHALKAISLNSVSKYAARLLPSVQDYYQKNNDLPQILTFGFAALLAYMEQAEDLKDTEEVIAFVGDHRGSEAFDFTEALISRFLPDLQAIPGFAETAANDLKNIRAQGIQKALSAILEETK